MITRQGTWRSRVPCRVFDGGFALTEVVVALSLLLVVATGALSFFVKASSSAEELRQQQSAVAVANQAMEQARAVTPVQSGAGMSGLVRGRHSTDVTAAWNASEATDRATTYQASDPSAVRGSAAASVPVTQTVRVSQQDYKATTLIGTCYRRETEAATTCGKVGGSEPTSTPAGYVKLMRVIVDVTWKPVVGSCESSNCTYRMTALVDPHGDLTWNAGSTLEAKDDTATVRRNQTVVINVLANDVIIPTTTRPVTIVQLPGRGSASATTNDGLVTFNGGTTAGTTTFTYRAKDASGRVTNIATVTVTIT